MAVFDGTLVSPFLPRHKLELRVVVSWADAQIEKKSDPLAVRGLGRVSDPRAWPGSRALAAASHGSSVSIVREARASIGRRGRGTEDPNHIGAAVDPAEGTGTSDVDEMREALPAFLFPRGAAAHRVPGSE